MTPSMWGRRLLLLACAAGCGEDIRANGPQQLDAAPAPIDAAIPEPDAAATTGRLELSWTVERDGVAIACQDTGAVELDALEIRLSPTAGGPALVYTAACADGEIAIDDLAPGSYIVRASSTGQGIEAGQRVVWIEAGRTADASVILGAPSGGMVHLTWRMQREGVPLSCADLGWGSFMVHLDQSYGGPFFPCEPRSAVVGPYTVGGHTLRLTAAANDIGFGTRGATEVEVEIADHGQTVYAQALFEYFDEPEKQLLQLFDAAAAHYATSPDPKSFPVPAAPTPPASSCTTTQSSPYDPDPSYWDSEPWLTLDFSLDHRHWAAYQFQSSGTDAEATFQVTAYLDTDCDGLYQRYWLIGTIGERGEVVGRDNLFMTLYD